MLSRRALTTAVRSARPAIRPRSHIPRAPFSAAPARQADPEIDDPDMNGGYINPPAIKRSHRDPYGGWDIPQERRNFGEPVHEDNDILGVFSLHDYDHISPAKAGVCWAIFISLICGLSYAVSLTYPDRPSAPKEYEGGLEEELGGPGAVRAWKAGDESK